MKISFKNFIPGIAWFFAVLYLMCLPGRDLPDVGWLDTFYFDKWVHAGLFALLVILLCQPFSNSLFGNKQRLQYFIKITIAVIIWGLTIEFIQKYFIEGRGFDLLDWAADTIGALIAFWICKRKFI